MTREEAIYWYRAIQNGKGEVWENTETYRENLKVGELAEELMEKLDNKFCYGIEYGILIAIAKIFDLKPEELRGKWQE